MLKKRVLAPLYYIRYLSLNISPQQLQSKAQWQRLRAVCFIKPFPAGGLNQRHNVMLRMPSLKALPAFGLSASRSSELKSDASPPPLRGKSKPTT
jgi:hypothetical protein